MNEINKLEIIDPIPTPGFSGSEFKPNLRIAERYSLENLAKEQGLTVEEFKLRIESNIKYKNDLIEKFINNGMNREYAEMLASMYVNIEGFSGPTFKD